MDPFVEKTSNPEYSKFIHLSRYSRYRDDLGRRETWEETIDRLIDFWLDRYATEHSDGSWSSSLSAEDYNTIAEDIAEAIHDLDIMPSMRSLMTAGKALDRDHVASFNCSYAAVDNPRVFDEIMYILMCGTGVGFSVERQYVNKLPEVAEEFHQSETSITFADSKIGWASGFRELVALLYAGKEPNLDFSKIRPAGSRLRTFGGRASGPEPLKDLCNFTIQLFKKAAGRKLSSLEVHDLVCKIADIVVVGGVRRSALISLSNLSDDRMRSAKSGQWWNTNPQRALANNSYVADERPEFDVFLQEWTSLYESKSGERGIFSRSASQKKAKATGRRDPDWEFGTNPCSLSADTVLLTTEGPRRIADLENRQFVAYVNGKPYRARRGSWISGYKDLYRLETKEGYTLDLTDDHRLMTKSGWKMSGDLEPGEKLLLCQHDDLEWPGKGIQDEGYLIGMFVGDGNFSKSASENGNHFGQLKVFRNEGFESLKESSEKAATTVFSNRARRKDWKMWCDYERNNYIVMNIGSLPIEFGIDPDKKHDVSALETLSSEFHIGFLRGMFDADGHVEGSSKSGYSIRLGQSDYGLLQSVQRMLARLGVFSKIYALNEERKALLPDGNGGQKEYDCSASWRLVISGKSARVYMDRIGFSDATKIAKAQPIYSVNHYNQKFEVTFDSLTRLGEFPVWDAEVDEVVSFDANGFHAHNSEILLRPNQFCNLTELVVRENDTFESLKEKVKKATILGTLQSTLTEFRYLRKVWKKNTEEERLLGVSMTGIMDHPVLNGTFFNDENEYELPDCESFDDFVGKTTKETLDNILEELKNVAIETNKEWAAKLGISPSAAITCVKPSGTVSQLVDSASGIHPRFSRYYLRTVRADVKDPIAHFMIDKGFYYEKDVMNPHNYVFYFPMKSPDSSVTNKDIGAMKQLEIWESYQDAWCEHKPSMTCYYTDDDFLDVGAWLWKKFDKVSGISFLPYDDHVYPQAPYQPISEDEYYEWLERMPKGVDWSELGDYESTDNTVGSQELACSGGSCEIS